MRPIISVSRARTSMKLFLSMLLTCLNAYAPSEAMLHLTNPGGPASEAQEVSNSSAIRLNYERWQRRGS
jgi:hypothetical protein